MIKLPVQKSVPINNLLMYTIFLYGREKIGKTSLASQFPDTLFLMCEPGGKSLSIYGVDINSWRDMLEAIALLEKDKRFKTVVVDTVDLALHFCQDYVCKKMAITHPSDEEYGKGWKAVSDEFRNAMVRLQKLGKGVIFISHAEEKQIKRRSGESSDRIQPTLSKLGRSVLEPMADLWAYYSYKPSGGRELVIRGDSDVSAGCRIREHFVGLSSIDMGRSEADAYKRFIAGFNQREAANTTHVPVQAKALKIRRQ